ncbi:MAG: GNAT family N-acetyltransferase [Aureispira sp.]|nr:GNAT family N-acetyltransferase [Aureispira sp.]
MHLMGGAVQYAVKYIINPARVIELTQNQYFSVVAESTNHKGIIGSGTIWNGALNIGSENLPYGFLNTLLVHPSYRKNGIAKEIANWRINQFEKKFGKEGVVYASIQKGNKGSENTASKWCTHFYPNRITLLPIKPRYRSVPFNSSFTVESICSEDIEEVVEQLNIFHKDYELYIPHSSKSFRNWLSKDLNGAPLHHYWLVKDKSGNILGGIGFIEDYRMRVIEILKMPFSMKIFNSVLKVIPSNKILRQSKLSFCWFKPNQQKAAKYLLENIRYHWRNETDNILCYFDTKSPWVKILGASPFMPSTISSIALKSPIGLGDNKLIYFAPI